MRRKTTFGAALLGALLAAAASGQAPASDRELFVSGSAFLAHDRAEPVTGLTAGALFQPAAEVTPSRADTIREMSGVVDWGVLHAAAAFGDGGRLTLPAFDGLTLELVVDHREQRSATSSTWFGRIAGIALSDFVLVREDDVVHLTVRDYPGSRTWTLRRDPSGAHVLRLLDRAAGGSNECATRCDASTDDPTTARPDAPPEGGYALGGVVDPANEVDVLFVATSQAFADFGNSTAAFEAAAQAFVADFNMRCANSDVDTHLRLSGLFTPAYTENADGGVDLDRITDDGDGWLDEVHDVRDDARADLVALIRSNKWGCSGNSCTYGVAWRPGSLGTMSTGQPNNTYEGGYGFSVTCLEGDAAFSFSHEIGHNYGACHDATTGGCTNANGDLVAITPSPRGIWRACEDVFGTQCVRTTMSYNPGCSYGTTSLPYWSRENLFINIETPFTSCNAELWDAVSKVQNLIHVSRSTLAQNRSGATLKWASAGATGTKNGTLLDPYATVQAAVAVVQGGVDGGIVRAKAGTYDESAAAGGVAVYGNPCRVEAAPGATLTLR